MAETVTNRGAYRAMAALVAGGGLRMLAFTGTQTGVHNKDHNTVADLDAVTGVAIHTERITLASVVASEDDANDRAAIDSADVVFAAAPGVTAQGVALYIEAGTDATRDLVAVYTSNFPQPMDGGLTVTVADLLRAT